jgi:hypothetical protein
MLNLIRPGADPGFNYYTLVQPQLQQQQITQQQGSQIRGLNRQLKQQQQNKPTPYGGVRTMRPTGGGASVQNYSHYYPRKGGGGGAGRTLSAGIGSGGGMGGGY